MDARVEGAEQVGRSGILGQGTTLYDTVLVGTCLYTFGQSQGTYNTETEP